MQPPVQTKFLLQHQPFGFVNSVIFCRALLGWLPLATILLVMYVCRGPYFPPPTIMYVKERPYFCCHGGNVYVIWPYLWSLCMHIHKHNEVPGHELCQPHRDSEIGLCVCVCLCLCPGCAHLRSYTCVHVYSVLDVEHVCVLYLHVLHGSLYYRWSVQITSHSGEMHNTHTRSSNSSSNLVMYIMYVCRGPYFPPPTIMYVKERFELSHTFAAMVEMCITHLVIWPYLWSLCMHIHKLDQRSCVSHTETVK